MQSFVLNYLVTWARENNWLVLFEPLPSKYARDIGDIKRSSAGVYIQVRHCYYYYYYYCCCCCCCCCCCVHTAVFAASPYQRQLQQQGGSNTSSSSKNSSNSSSTSSSKNSISSTNSSSSSSSSCCCCCFVVSLQSEFARVFLERLLLFNEKMLADIPVDMKTYGSAALDGVATCCSC